MKQDRHYFIALPVPSEQLASYAHRLPLAEHFHNVYTTEEYHLTLRFFGPLDTSSQQVWKERLQEIARVTEPFTLTFDRLITFGRPDRPRVVGFGTEAEILHRLVDEVNPASTKPFVPHVTIAKKWRTEAQEWTAPSLEAIEWSVRELILYEVRPFVSPRYEPVYRIRLGKEE